MHHLFLFHLQMFLRLFSIVLVAFFANYWLLIPAIIVFILLMLLRHYFLRTSRNIQRLEALGEMCSCVFCSCSLMLNCVQLVAHCILTYQRPFKVYPPLEHSKKRKNFLTSFTFIRMNTQNVGTLKSPLFVGLV